MPDFPSQRILNKQIQGFFNFTILGHPHIRRIPVGMLKMVGRTYLKKISREQDILALLPQLLHDIFESRVADGVMTDDLAVIENTKGPEWTR
jgi:hypothetical protein